MIICVGYTSLLAENDEFIVLNNSCTCEGYNQVYECRVTEGGTTLWTGAVFDCSSSSNELILFHTSSDMKVCNNGAIAGRIVRAENNTYVSQLIISVSTITVGTNISCSHETGSSTKLIGTSILTLTTGNTSLKTEN